MDASCQVIFGNKCVIDNLTNRDASFVGVNNNVNNKSKHEILSASSVQSIAGGTRRSNISKDDGERIITQQVMIISGPNKDVQNELLDSDGDISDIRADAGVNVVVSEETDVDAENSVDNMTEDKEDELKSGDLDETDGNIENMEEDGNQDADMVDEFAKNGSDDDENRNGNHNDDKNNFNENSISKLNNAPKGGWSRSYSGPTFHKQHETRQQTALCQLKLDIDNNRKYIDGMIIEQTIKPFISIIFRRLVDVGVFIKRNQFGDAPLDITAVMNPIINDLRQMSSTAMKEIVFSNIGSDIFDVFQSYDVICNDMNTNLALYMIFQHLAAFIQYLIALSIGHKRASDQNRISRQTPLTKIVSNVNLRKRINKNMYFGEMVSKYPPLFALNVKSTVYQTKIHSLIKILDENKNRICDEGYNEFPWNDVQVKQMYAQLYCSWNEFNNNEEEL